MSSNEVVTTETEQVSDETIPNLGPLEKGAKLADVIEKVNDLIEKVESIKVRDRGPKSSRAMTQDDATQVQKGGKLEGLKHMDAAKKLGLSYGQIYSARNGYTFQNRS